MCIKPNPDWTVSNASSASAFAFASPSLFGGFCHQCLFMCPCPTNRRLNVRKTASQKIIMNKKRRFCRTKCQVNGPTNNRRHKNEHINYNLWFSCNQSVLVVLRFYEYHLLYDKEGRRKKQISRLTTNHNQKRYTYSIMNVIIILSEVELKKRRKKNSSSQITHNGS